MCDKENPKWGKGKPVPKKVQQIVKNRFAELQNQNSERLQSGLKKLTNEQMYAEIYNLTTLSRRSIMKIINTPCTSPKKTKSRKSKFSSDNSDCDKLDDIIVDFYKKNVSPTVLDVYRRVKSDSTVSFKNCGRHTFAKIFKKMGYKYSNTGNVSREELMQRSDIVRKRVLYLKQKLNLDRNGSHFVFLDETFVHRNYLRVKILRPLNNSKKIRIKISISKGTRYSILHAGSIDGFVKKGGLILINSEFNSEKFENWIKTRLLPNIPPNSVIVYDNALTHSRQINKLPNQSTKNCDIKNWLSENSVQFDDKMKKRELLNIVKMCGIKSSYAVDNIIKNSGHIPLRLPPYHCQLNPIELIWAKLKTGIAKRNLNRNKEEFERLLSSSFPKIKSQYWQKCIRHVTKIEANYLISDKIINCDSINLDHNYCAKA